MPSHRGDLPAFERQFFGAGETFTRIGAGGIGGKAAGLEFVLRELFGRESYAMLLGYRVFT